MALKNAFGDIALDATSQDIADLLGTLAQYFGAINRSLGVMRVDNNGRLVTNVETGSSMNINGSVSANITNTMGSYATNHQFAAVTSLSADSLRRNITVS